MEQINLMVKVVQVNMVILAVVDIIVDHLVLNHIEMVHLEQVVVVPLDMVLGHQVVMVVLALLLLCIK